MLTRRLITTTLTALPALGVSVAWAAPAAPPAAEGECQDDSGCPTGYVCEVTGGSACACPEGGPCDCGTPVEYRSCVPGPCTSDADCADGMACATYEVPCAMDVPCSSDGNCGEAPPCESQSESICAPRWVLPCQADADCGAGFTCEETEICTCSGGGATPTDPDSPGSPDSSGGSDSGGSSGDASGEAPDAMPPADDCTCAPSGTKYCHATEVTCSDASACPSGWTCETYTNAVDCAAPDPADGSEAPPCDAPAEPPATSGICVPPYGGTFDSGVPRDASDGEAQYENGTALPVAANDGGGDGVGGADVGNNSGCAGGGAAIPVGGLALLVAAWWRRRAAA